MRSCGGILAALIAQIPLSRALVAWPPEVETRFRTVEILVHLQWRTAELTANPRVSPTAGFLQHYFHVNAVRSTALVKPIAQIAQTKQLTKFLFTLATPILGAIERRRIPPTSFPMLFVRAMWADDAARQRVSKKTLNPNSL